jgi:hypothetical protein
VSVVVDYRLTHSKGQLVIREHAAQRGDKPLLDITVPVAVGRVLVHHAQQVVPERRLARALEERLEVFRELALVVDIPPVCLSARSPTAR